MFFYLLWMDDFISVHRDSGRTADFEQPCPFRGLGSILFETRPFCARVAQQAEQRVDFAGVAFDGSTDRVFGKMIAQYIERIDAVHLRHALAITPAISTDALQIYSQPGPSRLAFREMLQEGIVVLNRRSKPTKTQAEIGFLGVQQLPPAIHQHIIALFVAHQSELSR